MNRQRIVLWLDVFSGFYAVRSLLLWAMSSLTTAPFSTTWTVIGGFAFASIILAGLSVAGQRKFATLGSWVFAIFVTILTFETSDGHAVEWMSLVFATAITGAWLASKTKIAASN